jgi:pyruvate carboxylase
MSSPRAYPARRFDPTQILPAERGAARIISNTARDAQQSNLSAEMADVHRQAIGRLINECYVPVGTSSAAATDGDAKPATAAPFLGYEQIWGGTIPMFDVWKRGVDPFAELREMVSQMRDTPASALIRANAINAMSTQPSDVVHEWVRLAYAAGVDVFTNFCAHNDWRNHINVAEAVHDVGGHYQAGLLISDYYHIWTYVL